MIFPAVQSSFKSLYHLLEELGAITLFSINIVKTGYKTTGNRAAIYEQIVSVINRSLSTILFAGMFVGAILVIQFYQTLRDYNADIYLGGLTVSAVVREIGPLIISFLLAGKIGAYTAAELGTMKVTEQIDAVQCLGTNPIQYLVVPRFFAIIFSSMILLFLGLVVSVGGATFVASTVCSVNPLQFIGSIPTFSSLWTLFSGLTKCVLYAWIVAAVSCFKGYTTSGGARGVGRAVTQSAIYTNLYIVLCNYVAAYLLTQLQNIFYSIFNTL